MRREGGDKRTSLVVHLLMQGTRAPPLVREEPPCRGAAKRVLHRYCPLGPGSRNCCYGYASPGAREPGPGTQSRPSRWTALSVHRVPPAPSPAKAPGTGASQGPGVHEPGPPRSGSLLFRRRPPWTASGVLGDTQRHAFSLIFRSQ